MEKNNKKILVLSDMSDSLDSILKSTVTLANIIGGEINLFYVKKPTSVVKVDNQFSAMRTINEDYNAVDNSIKDLVNPISKTYGIDINYKFSYGNVKNKIGEYIKEFQPDAIVLGKRKPKAVQIIGDNITDFVLKNHDGVILIASENQALEPNQELSLGVLSAYDQTSSSKFTEDLQQYTTKKVKSFKIVDKASDTRQTSTANDKQIVEFVFEKNENVVNNLSKYLVKNDINLFCIDRGNSSKKKKMMVVNDEFKSMMNKINVPLLLTDL